MSKRKKLWSESIVIGDLRVRIYEPRPGGNLMRSVWINGKEDRKSLGYKDRSRARAEMRQLLIHLHTDEHLLRTGAVTLEVVHRMYISSVPHRRKKSRTQKEDERKLDRVVTFFGGTRKVTTLCYDDVEEFIEARRNGDPRLKGIVANRTVGNRTIAADLVALQTMLNWATRKKDKQRGERLITENPLEEMVVPEEKNIKRPVMFDEAYEALLEVANDVDPLLRAAIIVAEGTGRRLSAIRQLRWSDVSFESDEFGRILWRKELDKKGHQMDVPISPAVREALLELRRRSDYIGDGWVFPAPKDPAKPCSRHLLDSWLRRAYEAANLDREPGGMWHPFRRRWATLRKHYPVGDLALAGGWKTVEAVQESYLTEDDETIRTVVLNPTNSLKRPPGKGGNSQQTRNAGGGI